MVLQSNKKMSPLCILEVLKEYSDENHPLTQAQILKKIEQNYYKTFKEIFLDCIIKLYRINVSNEEITEIDTFNLIDSIENKYEENRTKEGGRHDQL